MAISEVFSCSMTLSIPNHSITNATSKAVQTIIRRLARNNGSRIARAGLLDLDHVGAQVAQHHGRERAGEHLRQVEHAESGEGEGIAHRWIDPIGAGRP